jgi:hypothetical protein
MICAYASVASAQIQFQTPSDNELHSSYCQAVLKEEIAYHQAALATAEAGAKNEASMSPELRQSGTKQRAEAREMIGKLQTAQNRIAAYLMPRIMTLEPTAMLTALQRGKADWRDFNAMIDRCANKCLSLPTPQAEACWTSCRDAALIARIQACADPNWQPF